MFVEVVLAELPQSVPSDPTQEPLGMLDPGMPPPTALSTILMLL